MFQILTTSEQIGQVKQKIKNTGTLHPESSSFVYPYPFIFIIFILIPVSWHSRKSQYYQSQLQRNSSKNQNPFFARTIASFWKRTKVMQKCILWEMRMQLKQRKLKTTPRTIKKYKKHKSTHYFAFLSRLYMILWILKL